MSEVVFAPGESPFHAKGTVWLGIRKFVEAHVLGGVDSVNRELTDPHMREFFSQIFVAAGWYDILPIVTISKVIGSVMGLEQMEYVRRSAMWHAELDMKTVYKHLASFPTPEALCKRFASIHAQLYNFGKVDILEIDTNRVESVLTGMPAILAPWWQTAAEWYLYVLLDASGARNGRIMFQPGQRNGYQAGMELVTVPAVTVWD